jgi:stress response protein YsnF
MRLSLPPELLGNSADGGYQIGLRWAELTDPDARSLEVPLLAEEASVQVKTVERERVRVRRKIITENRVVETPVWSEHIAVETVPKDALVDRMPEVRQEGDTLVVPCVEEVVVVERRLRLREEVRIRVVREQVNDRQTIALRRHQIEVERQSTPKKQGDPT